MNHIVTSTEASSDSRPTTTDIRVGAVVGTADPRLFGSFVEHLGRGVYGGIYEPGHPSATSAGFRGDVLDLVKELGVTVVRYPGGNFVSGYDWRDGVGPRADRPRRLDLAWRSIESNAFGTDEFIEWCRAADIEPMLAVNMGLGDIRSVLHLLEYCNYESGTTLSDARARNGSVAPHQVQLWCLGNEIDGPWQLGHRTAEEYARDANTAATAMRLLDPDVELVAVGSSHAEMATLGEWEATVVRATANQIDHISCHIYFFDEGDLTAYLRSKEKLDGFLDTIAAAIRHAQNISPSSRTVKISLDEWNVWNYRDYDPTRAASGFVEAPRLLEQDYTAVDAIVVGSLLQSILAHADVVSIAALAQLVNAIGAIRTEPGGPAWRQSIFHPFALAAQSAGHTVHHAEVSGADDAVIATITRNPLGTVARVYLTHRGVDVARTVTLDLSALGGTVITSAQVIHHPNPRAVNSAERPMEVAPKVIPVATADGKFTVVLPPMSWTALSFELTR